MYSTTIEAVPVVVHCPLRATSFVWRDVDGRKAITVVCKATYVLRPDVSPLARDQEDIHVEDIRWGADRRDGLRTPSDLVPFKRRVDILVLGRGHAPHGHAARSLLSRVAVGAVDKAVGLQGDLELGPIAPESLERARMLGRSAASWDHRLWYTSSLPRDIDAGYFNCAPRDQQVDQIAPDERIVLENLHPEHPRLVTRLGGIVPRAVLRSPGEAELPLNLRCDTLSIDSKRGTCSVTWRGTVPREPARRSEIHIDAKGGDFEASEAESTLFLSNDAMASAVRRAELPFKAGGANSALASTGMQRPLPIEKPEKRSDDDDGSMTLFAPQVSNAPALPFGWGGSSESVLRQPMSAPMPPPWIEQEPPSSESEVLTQRPPPPPPAMLGEVAPENEKGATLDEPGESAAPSLDPASFSIERWAEIVAEIDKAEKKRAEVLRVHDIRDADFAAVDEHWSSALRREAATGGYSLRSKYDTSYVGALERLRGRPISAAEYARLLSAAERRQVPVVLGELEMPEAAHLPIVRSWTSKIARDPKLSFAMMQAVAALRDDAGNS